MNIKPPYLLFLGESALAKTAQGVRDWRPELCAGQLRFPGSTLDLQLPEMNVDQAVNQGVKTLVIGVAPAGGQLPENWISTLKEALEKGLDIANGLHTRLNLIPELREVADHFGRRIFDVRYPEQVFEIGQFEFRPGRRLLTVGTDCVVGKMYTTLAIEQEMKKRHLKADFRATGQTGILIAGQGISVDAVVSDFVSAASATLSPANDPDHWDLVEGQGSLFHPAYAGVTLGLVHGSQPDALVLCTDPTRKTIALYDEYPQPSLKKCIDTYTDVAKLTNANARVVGISMNTFKMDDAGATALLEKTQQDLGLPCVDPVRTGVGAIVDVIERFEELG